jgi:hypothetical protein
MVLGLALQAAGYAWVAAIAAPGIDYLQLGLAFTLSGVGTSFCFPTVANAVMGAVPLRQAGIASGANSALRELGGVVGITVVASVFARQGSYATPSSFIAGFAPAIWIAVVLSGLGILAALLTGRARPASESGPAAAQVPGAPATVQAQ